MHKITHSNFSSEAAIVISVSRDFLHTLRVDIEADFLKIGYRRFRIFLLFATSTSVIRLFTLLLLRKIISYALCSSFALYNNFVTLIDVNVPISLHVFAFLLIVEEDIVFIHDAAFFFLHVCAFV
jgi:hypothetical protein